MDLNEYQNRAAETAFYPGRQATLSPDCKHGDMLKCSPIPFPGYAYTLLGLIGELSEMEMATHKTMVCDREEANKAKAVLVKEIGDVFWYLSQFTMEMGIPFSNIDSKIEWKIGSFKPTYSCGAICELIKKTIRDNFGNITPQTKEKVLFELRHIYSYLIWFCRIHEVDPNHVMEENIKKLTSRKDRGVLGGSGDER